MHIYLSLLLIIGFPFWSCTSDRKNNKSKTTSIASNEYNIEQLIQIDETPSFNHNMTTQPANGKIFQILENDKKVYLGQLINGKPDGLWIKWSENGIKIEEGNYNNGLLEGYFALYHKNGSKSLEGSILHSKKNGLFAMYHENGVRSFRGEYFDGIGKGKWVYYNEEGTIIRQKDCDLEECK
tara:strand:+ start:168 stop:713 length:546 start_codon:yes stop_codon:yes gene_type:complete